MERQPFVVRSPILGTEPQSHLTAPVISYRASRARQAAAGRPHLLVRPCSVTWFSVFRFFSFDPLDAVLGKI